MSDEVGTSNPSDAELASRFTSRERILHWRDQWYAWTGSGYIQVSHTSVEQRAFTFLCELPTVGVSRSKVSSLTYLAKMTCHLEDVCSPCWLDGRESPSPHNVIMVENGILDLTSTPRLMSADPHLFAPDSVNYQFDPAASCPTWKRFLGQLWSEPGQIRMLQEWFGYFLLPDTSQQKILAIIGPPRSGKSTIARVLTELLGRIRVASPSIRDLSGHFGLWGLLEKQLAIIPDAMLPTPCPAVEELLKSVSGEDSVDVHRKGLPPLTGIRLSTRLMLIANEMPVFRDPGGALDRRLIVLPTTVSFSDQEDTALTMRLLEELPGILNWAIQGLAQLRQRGRFISKDALGVKSDIATRLRQGKQEMKERCLRIGKLILDEAGVENVEYHQRLSGWANPELRTVKVPRPTTRRRLYVVARESGHVKLHANKSYSRHRAAFEVEMFAHRVLRQHRIPVPRRSTQAAKKNVARQIRQALRHGDKRIDADALQWCKKELSTKDLQLLRNHT